MNVRLATLTWNVTPSEPGAEVNVASVSELDQQLDSLASQVPAAQPMIVDVVRSKGDSLSIGLGQPRFVDDNGDDVEFAPAQPVTVLAYSGRDGDPPYYVSRGHEPIPCLIVFFYGGHWSEYPGDSAISLSVAREAIRQFVSSDNLPTNVNWNDV